MTESNPNTPSQSYLDKLPDLDLITDLLGGTRAMWNAAEKWLPREPEENDEDYARRLKRTVFFNGFARTVDSLVGKPFSKPVTIGEDLDETLVKYLENVDRGGRHIDVFSRDAFRKQLTDGLVYLLVDAPKPVTDEEGQKKQITIEEKNKLGLRPYLVLIDRRQVIAWRTQVLEGKETLIHVRIREIARVPADEWVDVEKERVRVFDRVDGVVSYRLYEKQETAVKGKEEWQLIEQGVTDWSVIPLVAVYGNEREDYFVTSPPLLNLAWLNLCHWQSSSDQRNILHVTRCPILFGSGWDESTKVVVGPSRLVTNTNADAKLQWVEHTGQAIGAGDKDLEKLENQMALMGAELLARKTIKLTATEASADQAAEDSHLKAMARALEDGLEAALTLMAEAEGLEHEKEGAGSLSINKDFKDLAQADVAELQTLVALNQAGKISHLTLLQEFQRRGVLSSNVDLETEITLATNEVDFDSVAPAEEEDDED